MDFLNKILDNFTVQKKQQSFCIDNRFYTYGEFNNLVSNIVNQLRANNNHIVSKRIAVVATNHINTYAGLIACWVCGYAYIPLGLHNPDDRNLVILEDADIGLILSSKQLDQQKYSKYRVIDTSAIIEEDLEINIPVKINENDLAYILFTSGSTGKPKGVPISFGNLSSFLEAFKISPIEINVQDKCLQMFELTFDVSISSYLPALVAGATIYTVSDVGLKYLNVLKLLNTYQLNVIQIVPSIIKLGMPLLSRLCFKEVKHCILTGEATTVDLLDKWKACIPTAQIYNYYGPTECTIYCSYYQVPSNTVKRYNGMLAIGKPFYKTHMLIVDEQLNEVANNVKGELLIYSPQLTQGYLNNPEKNSESFVEKIVNDETYSYYKSGDMCYKDEGDDIFYCGRFDNQVKIQGFRVELSEIEYKVRQSFGINNVVVPLVNKVNATEIILVLEKKTNEQNESIFAHLKLELPTYMIPKDIFLIEELPINTSGKTDRVKVKQFIYENFNK